MNFAKKAGAVLGIVGVAMFLGAVSGEPAPIINIFGLTRSHVMAISIVFGAIGAFLYAFLSN